MTYEKTLKPICPICNEWIGPKDLKTAWPQVVGFNPPRKGGGGNQIVLRRDTGVLCHAGCGEKARHRLKMEREAQWHVK